MFRGGRVIDPTQNLDDVVDIRVDRGVVTGVGELVSSQGERVIDVGGLTVAPGLIDVHVHLREPGQEWKETIERGTATAAAGGFTTVFCMPNTEPALDSVVALEQLRRCIDRGASVEVHPIATISEGRKGRLPVDFDALVGAGAVGFSDDGESTRDSAIMREALEASRRLERPVMVHCEDPALTGGAMHDGDISRELGIGGLPAAAEEIMIERDLALASLTGGWLHVCHVSTANGARAIATSKAKGVRVTAEVMPHHLTMTDDWVAGCRTTVNTADTAGQCAPVAEPDTKVNPPLRSAADTRGLLRALQTGAIDIVATDHAPHARSEKQGRPFATAAFGLSGSETALPLLLALVRAKHLNIHDVIRALSAEPARLWRLPAGTLRPGAPADIVAFDPDERWTVDANRLVSRGANSPLLGIELQGRVKMTVVGGDVRYRDW